MQRYCQSTRAILVFALAVSSTTLWAEEFLATPIPNSHPFVGRWRFDIPKLNCFEEYHVRADGTRSTISGQERNESEFSISLTSDAAGYYKFIDKITKNNGKPDCTGFVTPVGDIATNYLLFHRDGNRFLLCQKPDFATCMSPYVRVKAPDA
jgi:hypothetical protein